MSTPLIHYVISLNQSTNGRDKTMRLVQYGSRVAWTGLEDWGIAVHRLKQLEDALSSARKALQLGRFVDLLYSAQRSVRLDKDVHRITLTMSKIATALFLMVDNLLWLARMGIVDIDRRKWFLTSCRLWLYSIMMNLVRDWYEVRQLLAQSSVPNRERKRETQSPAARILSLVTAKPGLSIDLLKNTCDFWIPMSALNHTPLSPHTIGVLGLVSSVCALLQVMDPSLSLHPC